MGTFSEQSVEEREQSLRYIDDRWRQLHELEQKWGEKCLRYLMLINSGGALATLGYLGTVPIGIRDDGVKWALVFFVLGVILVGVSTAKQFHHMSGLFKSWKSSVDRYYNNELKWVDVTKLDDRKAVEDFLDYAIPYFSFISFLVGVLFGAASLS